MKATTREAPRRQVEAWRLGISAAAGGMVMATALAGAAAAQTANPSALIEQQNQAQLKKLRSQSEVRQSGPIVIGGKRARAETAPPGGPTVLLKGVDFVGHSDFLSQAQLDAITAKYIGHRVDFSQILQLVHAINTAYDKLGVVTASAVLPPQTLSNGVLKLRLVEGKLGAVSFTGRKALPEAFVLKRVKLTIGKNTVDVPRAAKDITYFNSVYNARLRLSLKPGTIFGTTDVVLALTEPKTNQLSFFIDNEGVDSTGKAEFGVYYHRYSLLRPDDNFVTYATLSHGSRAGTLSYDLPISQSGTRLALSYSLSSIKVVNGPSKPLDITGTSRAANMSLSQPLAVTAHWASFATAGLGWGRSQSKSAGVPLVDAKTERAHLGLSIRYTGRHGAFAIQPKLVFARTRDYLQPSSRNIRFFSGTFNGVHRFGNGLALTFNGAWQKTNAKLVPSDLLFQVGGPGTVRGYPNGAGSGDSGFFTQIELHKALDKWKTGTDIYGFLDGGAVYSTYPSSQVFISAGLGLSYPVSNRAKLDVGLGVPLRKVVANQSGAELYARLTLAAF